MGNQRYDALALSGNGVGSEIDGGHYKSSSGPRFRLRARGPELPQRCRPFVLQGPYTTLRMRVLSEPRKVTPSGSVIQLRPTLANRKRDPVGRVRFRKSSVRPNPTQTLHQAFCIDGGSGGAIKRLAVISARRSPTCKPTERIAGRAARIFRRRIDQLARLRFREGEGPIITSRGRPPSMPFDRCPLGLTHRAIA